MPTAAELLVKYESAKTQRNPGEQDWKLASMYCLPNHYGNWQSQSTPSWFNNSSQQVRRMVYDSTGMRALPKYMAILERLITPNGMRYQGIRSSDPTLMKKRRVKEYYEEWVRLLFRYRSLPRANFRAATSEMFAQLGAYGNGPIYVGRRQPNALSRQPMVMYRSHMLNDIFWSLNNQGEVDTTYRRYFLNLRQFRQENPETPLPPCMRTITEGDEAKKIEFVQIVHPRSDDTYDPDALDARRHPMSSVHICVPDKMFIGVETGFRRPPLLTPRTFTMADQAYGAGPAVQALASLGGASQIKKTHLKQGNMAADPVILSADDGALNGQVDLRPGHVNPGGISRDGKRLIDILPTGDWRVSEALLADERDDVNDSFFVTLFQILMETPEMTATEVMERVAERASLLSPTMGRLQTEFLGPLTEREIDVITEIGRAPIMPPELIEASGEYENVYTSPMAKGEYAEEVSGFTRLLSMMNDVATATGDPSGFDHIDFDTAYPEIADNMSVPVRWTASAEDVAAKRDSRGKQQQQDMMMKNAPALASAAKTASEMGAKP